VAASSKEKAVSKIAEKFGKEFTYVNENGNEAIRKDVLSAFRKLTADSIVWGRYWRTRKQTDKPSRQQDWRSLNSSIRQGSNRFPQIRKMLLKVVSD
jgi:hypothetical protein